MNPPGRDPDRIPDLQIPDATDRFIIRNRPGWKGETARTYRKSLDTLEEFFSERESVESVADLERWTLGQYQDWLVENEYARATVQSKQKQARLWVKWLESQGLVEVGLHLAIQPIKLSDKEQTSSDILEPDQIKKYLAYYRNSPKWRGTRRHALLEVISHTGARRSGIRALDVADWDSKNQKLVFMNRPERGTRLKRGDSHQRKVVLSGEPAQVVDEFIAQNRLNKHDENGREPLFASRQGRPTKSTITNWVYTATQPCIMQECPHSKERHNCEWTKQTKASQCPSSSSPHPVRRGSITWQLNIGRDPKDVAARAATTPEVIRRYYDRPDLDAELRRRITEFDNIDICEHADPTDVNEDID